MHYSSGNYEAFVRPRKPEGADKKTAWFVGSGLAGLAGAAFLIRDGGVSGDRIQLLSRIEDPETLKQVRGHADPAGLRFHDQLARLIAGRKADGNEN